MAAVFRREWKAYFLTAVGIVFAVVFLAAASSVFFINNVVTRSSDLSPFFSMLSYLWLLLCPVLVMRLIAGERKQMTDQLLLTAPVSLSAIVWGKYAAASAMLLVTSLGATVYPLIVSVFGQVYWPEVAVMYLGFLLVGNAFLAFDLLLSAMFRNATGALVFGIGANLLLWLSSLFAATSDGPVRKLVSVVNLYDRLTPFLHGQLSLANIFYYLAFCAVCVIGATLLVKGRQWNEAL